MVNEPSVFEPSKFYCMCIASKIHSKSTDIRLKITNMCLNFQPMFETRFDRYMFSGMGFKNSTIGFIFFINPDLTSYKIARPVNVRR